MSYAKRRELNFEVIEMYERKMNQVWKFQSQDLNQQMDDVLSDDETESEFKLSEKPVLAEAESNHSFIDQPSRLNIN